MCDNVVSVFAFYRNLLRRGKRGFALMPVLLAADIMRPMVTTLSLLTFVLDKLAAMQEACS